MSDKIKCYKFIPGGYFDSLIVRAIGNWVESLQDIETLLDNYFRDDRGEDIELTIDCIYLTQEELNKLDIGKRGYRVSDKKEIYKRYDMLRRGGTLSVETKVMLEESECDHTLVSADSEYVKGVDFCTKCEIFFSRYS